MNARSITILAASVLLIAVSAPLSAQSPADPLLKTLDTSYNLTKMGFGGSSRVTHPGTVYIVHVDGLLARAIADHVTPTTTIKDGQALPSAKGFKGAFGATGDTRQVQPGERFYVVGIELKGDATVFRLVSLETHVVEANGGSVQSRFRMLVKFPLNNVVPESLTAADVQKLSNPIFSPEGAPVPVPQVQLGESLADVETAFGQPDKIVDLGPKTILAYKNLKVVLVDGKVTDAE
ncbi:MAG: hypothetical protein WB439_15655 [Acidobacteriaceae bacterium]